VARQCASAVLVRLALRHVLAAIDLYHQLAGRAGEIGCRSDADA
jgi:hypothetical protein